MGSKTVRQTISEPAIDPNVGAVPVCPPAWLGRRVWNDITKVNRKGGPQVGADPSVSPWC